MAVYIIMTIISMLFAGYAQNVKEVKSLDSTYRILGVMAFLPFAVVSALRYQVGTDWPIYNDYFHSIPAGGKKFTEPLFNLLNRFLYHFTHLVCRGSGTFAEFYVFDHFSAVRISSA